jgi:hypothetical protein
MLFKKYSLVFLFAVKENKISKKKLVYLIRQNTLLSLQIFNKMLFTLNLDINLSNLTKL